MSVSRRAFVAGIGAAAFPLQASFGRSLSATMVLSPRAKTLDEILRDAGPLVMNKRGLELDKISHYAPRPKFGPSAGEV